MLGQSGDAVFEKHYQSQFIGRDLQHVVLLRPPQEGLLRLAGSMLRKRDLLAPSSQLTNAQRRAICQSPEILELRREKRELMEEMRSLAGTVKKAQKPFPHLYERHEEVKKELSQLRKTMTRSTQETARKTYFHDAPVIEVSKQIKRLLGPSVEGDGDAADSSEEDDWELPIPDYVFPERGASWKTSTDLKQRILTKISCLHDESRLPRTWLHSQSSASQIDGESESTGVWTLTPIKRSPEFPFLLKRKPWNVRRMFALSVTGSLVLRRLIHLHTSFLQSEWTLFVAISSILISPLCTMESAAIGQLAAMFPGSLKSLRSWPMR